MYLLKLESLRNRLLNSSNLNEDMLNDLEECIDSVNSILDERIKHVKET